MRCSIFIGTGIGNHRARTGLARTCNTCFDRLHTLTFARRACRKRATLGAADSRSSSRPSSSRCYCALLPPHHHKISHHQARSIISPTTTASSIMVVTHPRDHQMLSARSRQLCQHCWKTERRKHQNLCRRRGV